jgi:hypothetical protein
VILQRNNINGNQHCFSLSHACEVSLSGFGRTLGPKSRLKTKPELCAGIFHKFIFWIALDTASSIAATGVPKINKFRLELRTTSPKTSENHSAHISLLLRRCNRPATNHKNQMAQLLQQFKHKTVDSSLSSASCSSRRITNHCRAALKQTAFSGASDTEDDRGWCLQVSSCGLGVGTAVMRRRQTRQLWCAQAH